MVQIKHFTAPQKMPNFQFSRRAKWPWRDKILGAPQCGQKIIVNQSKPILVIVSMKPFTRQSFKQNYFSREIDSLLRCCSESISIKVSDLIIVNEATELRSEVDSAADVCKYRPEVGKIKFLKNPKKIM